MSAQSTLDAARLSITAKNYDQARSLLRTIPNDPTAQQWLVKLDEIAPEPPIFNELEDTGHVTAVSAKSDKKVLRLILSVLSLLSFGAGIFFLIMTVVAFLTETSRASMAGDRLFLILYTIVAFGLAVVFRALKARVARR